MAQGRLALGSRGAVEALLGPEEAPATATNQGAGIGSNSPQLAIDPTDDRFVVLAHRLDAPDFSCALEYSSDGGRSFAPAVPLPALPPGADKCYAPEVAFDRRGGLYFLFVGLSGPGNVPMGAFLTESSDRARTFSPPRRVLGPLNFGVRMAIDGDRGPRGRIHLVWLHTGADPALGGFAPVPNPILAAYSDDGGATFSEPVAVSEPSRRRVVSPALALGPRGSVTVAYYDLGDDARDYQGLEGPTYDGTWSVVVSRSADGGERFSPGSLVDAGVAPSGRVMLVFTMPPPALAAGRQRTCVAWTDARFGDDDALLRCAPAGGLRWGPLVRLNDDRKGNGASQYLPKLAIAPDGRVDALFYDRGADVVNRRARASYTYSRDGRRFAAPVPLSGEAFDATVGQQYGVVSADGLVEFGSRLGLVARPHGALAAWTDTRNSTAPSTAQDVYARTVDLPAEGAPGWARVGGACGAATGLALVSNGARRRRRRRG